MSNSLLSIPVVLLALLGLVLLFEYTHIDYFIQSYFYNIDTGQWLIDENNVILDFILYSGIKKLFVVMVLCLLFTLVFLRRLVLVKRNIKGLCVVVLSILIIPMTIGGLKDVTNMPCPNQLSEFGGHYKKVGLFEVLPKSNPRPIARCYPAGHASSGFALLSLFFLFKSKKAKRIALIVSCLIGWSTASYKILIGDHFFSHTLVTMLLAWLIILFIVIFVNKIADCHCQKILTDKLPLKFKK